jgi:hypothetical protein
LLLVHGDGELLGVALEDGQDDAHLPIIRTHLNLQILDHQPHITLHTRLPILPINHQLPILATHIHKRKLKLATVRHLNGPVATGLPHPNNQIVSVARIGFGVAHRIGCVGCDDVEQGVVEGDCQAVRVLACEAEAQVDDGLAREEQVVGGVGGTDGEFYGFAEGAEWGGLVIVVPVTRDPINTQHHPIARRRIVILILGHHQHIVIPLPLEAHNP